MDTGKQGELLAANLSVEEIRTYIGVDSIAYLSLDRLKEATGAVNAGFCDACLTGDYPVEVSVELSKEVLDEAPPSPAAHEEGTLALLFDEGAALPADDARSRG
jgi:amidophosphoribosyltransferase